jgi:DNA-binding response OmpR family regulator
VTKTILIVDDDPQIPALLKTFLTEKGYHVVVARDGWAGVHGSLNTDPDLILLDLDMPVMDGMTALATIRSAPNTANKRRRPRVFIITGHSEIEAVLAAKKLGVDGFVAKPFDLKDLVKRIEGALYKIDYNELRELMSLLKHPSPQLGGEAHLSKFSKEIWETYRQEFKGDVYHLAVSKSPGLGILSTFSEKEIGQRIVVFINKKGTWQQSWP